MRGPLVLDHLLRLQILLTFQRLDGLYIPANDGLRRHDLVADGVHLVGGYDVVDDAKTVALERQGTSSDGLLDRIRRGAEGVGAGANEFGGERLWIVGRLGQQIARLLQFPFEASDFGVQCGEFHCKYLFEAVF